MLLCLEGDLDVGKLGAKDKGKQARDKGKRGMRCHKSWESPWHPRSPHRKKEGLAESPPKKKRRGWSNETEVTGDRWLRLRFDGRGGGMESVGVVEDRFGKAPVVGAMAVLGNSAQV